MEIVHVIVNAVEIRQEITTYKVYVFEQMMKMRFHSNLEII